MNSLPANFEPVWAIGFMTGTSVDAVDAAMVLTDGERVLDLGPCASIDYSSAERDMVHAAVQAARDWNWKGPAPETAFDAARRIAVARHRDALDSILADWTGPRPALAGVHGQTVLHRRPANGMRGATLQIVDAAGMADALQMPVVFDFRSADIAAGGEGAPLAPVYHRALLDRSQLEKSAVVNLGGVANVTFCEADTPLIAFDTGPANGPIDEWIAGHGLGVRDEDGRLAASGRVHRGHLDQILDHVYFDEPPPKSLDRYDFNANLVRGLSPADGAATLTALCAESLARAFEHAAVPVDRIVLCGGGRHNPALVSAIEAAVPCRVVSAEAVGWRGDSIEAEAFAYLAVRSMRGLPISFSGTTGVPDPLSGGQMIEPRSMPI